VKSPIAITLNVARLEAAAIVDDPAWVPVGATDFLALLPQADASTAAATVKPIDLVHDLDNSVSCLGLSDRAEPQRRPPRPFSPLDTGPSGLTQASTIVALL
jgi:hypothetical protein